MPWVTDQNGEKKYNPSIYAKEELPTWSEIYEEWYLGEKNLYDPRNPEHQELDPYWKIPRRLFLIGSSCNQLNKMIFEDGKPLVKFAQENINKYITDVRFVCEGLSEFAWPVDAEFFSEQMKNVCLSVEKDLPLRYEDTEFVDSVMVAHGAGTPDPPPIYSFFMPNGKPNPFILPSKTMRKFFVRVMGKIYVRPLITIDIVKANSEAGPYGHRLASRFYTPDPQSDTIIFPEVIDHYNKIMEFMMTDMAEYFGGESVGWKGTDGKTIENESAKKCPAGYDPAL